MFNLEANDFIEKILLKTDKERLFVFLDPPYYKQGKNLYTNFFQYKDHENLSVTIKKMDDYFWIMTYDNEPEILEIYKNYNAKLYEINYSANKKTRATELFFHATRH